MKRIIIILLCTFTFLIIGISIYKYIEGTRIGKFSITDYKEMIEKFPSDIILGEILTSQIAKEEAEKIWIDIYGEEIKKEKPYKVSFDKEQRTWLVSGTFHRTPFGSTKGGVAYAIIQESEGKVLAIWHER